MTQARLCDLDLRPRIRSDDGRHVDLMARGLPICGGLPVCGDAALFSAVHADGSPWTRADTDDGSALDRTDAVHRRTYHEICASDRMRFIMLGAELGGRLSAEALKILLQLARNKAREVPALLQCHAALAWHRRWLTMISVAVKVAAAESLLSPTSKHHTEIDGATPRFSELPGRDSSGAYSRLPLRG